MLSIIVGALFIAGGSGAGLIVARASNMAADHLTAWKLALKALFIFTVLAAIGVALIVWR